MFVRLMGLGLPAALGGLYMTGTFDGAEGQIFDVPAAQVYSRLSSMTIPAELRQGTDGGVSVEREPDNVVRWKMTAKGYEVLRVTATITPLADGKAAAVATELEFAETGPQGADGKVLNSMGGVKTIGTMLMEEQIASTVEGRPFNQNRVKTRIGVYALAHREELRVELAQVEGLIKSTSWADVDSYATNGAGSGVSRPSRPTFESGEAMTDARPMMHTRPMVDVSR